MSLATLQEFYDRVDSDVIYQLTLRSWSASDTPTDDQNAQRDAKSQDALDDASAIILGFQSRVSSQHWPAAERLRVDCIHVALNCLTGSKAIGEYKVIADNFQAVLAFYEKLVEQSTDIGITASSPPPVFNHRNLRGLVR